MKNSPITMTRIAITHRIHTPSTGLRHPFFNHCSRKLSANEHFFVGAQTILSLLQTIQIKRGVSFIAAKKTSAKKTHNRLKRDGTLFFFFFFFFLPEVDVSHVYVRALALGCFYSHVSSTGTRRRALHGQTAVAGQLSSVVAVTKSGRVWRKGAGKRCSECEGTLYLHVNTGCIHPGYKEELKKRVPSRFKRLWFYFVLV